MKKSSSISAGHAFLLSVALLLGVTALAKLYSAAGEARILGLRDPLLLVTNREVLMGVGLLELAVVAYLLFGRRTVTKYLLIVWLGLNFIVYRVGLWWVAPGRPCPCLGTLTARLPLKPATVDLLLKLMIGVMLFGSGYFLLRDWLRGPSRPRAGAAEETVVDQSAGSLTR